MIVSGIGIIGAVVFLAIMAFVYAIIEECWWHIKNECHRCSFTGKWTGEKGRWQFARLIEEERLSSQKVRGR